MNKPNPLGLSKGMREESIVYDAKRKRDKVINNYLSMKESSRKAIAYLKTTMDEENIDKHVLFEQAQLLNHPFHKGQEKTHFWNGKHSMAEVQQ